MEEELPETFKLIGHGRNNAIFRLKRIRKYAVRIPFFNKRKVRRPLYEQRMAGLLSGVQKYLVQPEGSIKIEESVLVELESKYGFQLTRDSSSFSLLRNFYSKEIEDGEEVVVVEIKPKMGLVEPLFEEAAQTRAGALFQAPYCMLKERKELAQGKKQLGSYYDPRQLYSGNQEAMAQALQNLSSVPNRYWRVRAFNSTLDIAKLEERAALWKEVAGFLVQSGVLSHLAGLQKLAVKRPATYYWKRVQKKLAAGCTHAQFQEQLEQRLDGVKNVSDLEQEGSFLDEMLRLLLGKLAGDVTLLLRITRGGKPEEGELLAAGGGVRCRLGIIDFDGKYASQTQDWAAEREETAALLLSQEQD